VLTVAASKQLRRANRGRSNIRNESQITWSPDITQIAFVGQPHLQESASLRRRRRGGTQQDVLARGPRARPDRGVAQDGSIMMQTRRVARAACIDRPSSKKSRRFSRLRVVTTPHCTRRSRPSTSVATDMTHPTELFVANADAPMRQSSRRSRQGDAEVAWADAEDFHVPVRVRLKVRLA